MSDMALNNPSQLFRLDGRTIILSGGIGGLGHVLCITLLQQGADVVCTDLPAEPPQEAWDEILAVSIATGNRLSYHQCDVTIEASIDAAFEKADQESRYPLRGLVTCAGISGRSPAIDYPIGDFRKIMEINVIGTFLCAQAAARIFHKHKVPASIVMLASMSGTNVNRGVDTCAYNTSKSAILQMARNLAAEWGNDPEHPPIRVNTLSPGYILTPITEPTINLMPELKQVWCDGNMLGRLSRAHEHRAAILFLLGDGSSYVTAADLRADGGHTAW